MQAALNRSRMLVIAALLGLVAMSWGWLFSGAGMDMTPENARGAGNAMGGMTDMAQMPGMADMTSVPDRTLARLALTFSMWWVMMVAMMLPSAAPTVLLYEKALENRATTATPATTAFLLGYLLVWGLFSLAASVMQAFLEMSGLVDWMAMASASRYLSAGLLVAAGLYQLSPLKAACLRHCRSPAQFLARHYRPGRTGALAMGMRHGAYCVGCCWLLMALLFVGGVMNLLWIAFLTLVVAAEKLVPGGFHLAKVLGLACIAWGILIAFSA